MSIRFGTVVAFALIGLASCLGSPPTEPEEAREILREEFPEAQAAVRAALLELTEHARRHDGDGQRSAHLDSPKFSRFGGGGLARQDFEETVAEEIAAFSKLYDLSTEFPEMRVDVFGEVAILTSLVSFSATDESGKPVEAGARLTLVYVDTPDGWKIVHEHVSAPAE